MATFSCYATIVRIVRVLVCWCHEATCQLSNKQKGGGKEAQVFILYLFPTPLCVSITLPHFQVPGSIASQQ